MSHIIEQYLYQVHFSEEDQAYVGTCKEFPSLSVLKISSEMALSEIRSLVLSTLTKMEQNQESLPVPIHTRWLKDGDIERTETEKEDIADAAMVTALQGDRVIAEIAAIFNQNGIDAMTNTPDYLLATLAVGSIMNYGLTVAERDRKSLDI